MDWLTDGAFNTFCLSFITTIGKLLNAYAIIKTCHHLHVGLSFHSSLRCAGMMAVLMLSCKTGHLVTIHCSFISIIVPYLCINKQQTLITLYKVFCNSAIVLGSLGLNSVKYASLKKRDFIWRSLLQCAVVQDGFCWKYVCPWLVMIKWTVKISMSHGYRNTGIFPSKNFCRWLHRWKLKPTKKLL